MIPQFLSQLLSSNENKTSELAASLDPRLFERLSRPLLSPTPLTTGGTKHGVEGRDGKEGTVGGTACGLWRRRPSRRFVDARGNVCVTPIVDNRLIEPPKLFLTSSPSPFSFPFCSYSLFSPPLSSPFSSSSSVSKRTRAALRTVSYRVQTFLRHKQRHL